MPLHADPDYIELALHTEGEAADIWAARLAEAGFEAFAEEEGILRAYIRLADAAMPEAQEMIDEARASVGFVSVHTIAAQNWNQTWEDNFEPVTIAGKLQIRAAHHVEDLSCPIRIQIEPKMSFGTGHHATTAGMAALQLETDHTAAHVIDAGCGTGILAILAEKLGATSVEAFDHEAWAVENARENAELNACTRLTIAHAELGAYTRSAPAHIVLANITRNLVIEHMPAFASWLHAGGTLLTSGFYIDDLPAITAAAQSAGLTYLRHTEENRWCAAAFVKG